ncbi:MAG: DEAD/DEAH box helicase [Bacteroidota bacterium]
MTLTSFTDLGISKNIIQALSESGITQPTEIQQKAIPILLQDQRDFIGLAQTGTGKTAAFGLPLLQHMHVQQRAIQALVLSPTRELGQQIANQLAIFSKHLSHIAIQAVYGGVAIGPQINALKRSPKILVATPGRLIDLVDRKVIDLAQVKYLVLDEADEMLNMGFKPAINQILSFLPRKRSIWLFSATMPPEIARLVHRYMSPDHTKVEVSPKNKVNRNIEHQYMVCPAQTKQSALLMYLNTDKSKRGIIFCRTKAAAQRLSQNLVHHGLQVDALHGDLSQSKRDKVMKRFKNKQLQALVATDVAARGIDVKDLNYVIHYHLPDQLEYYTHRSGRTARAGKRGVSLSLVTRQECNKVKQMGRTLGVPFQQLESLDKKGLDKLKVMAGADKLLATPSAALPDATLVKIAEEAFAGLSKQELVTKLVHHFIG